MAHYEDWLAEQAATVTTVGGGSVKATRIVLEIAGQTYGTWAAATPSLSDVVRTAIVRVTEELPRGQHLADLIATDDSGQAVARLPITIKGNNSAAGTQHDGILAMNRGVTVLVGNFEAAISTMQRQVELQGKQAEVYLSQSIQLIDALQGVMASKSGEELERARLEASSARWDALFAKLAPLVEMGLGVLAIEVERKYSKLPAAPVEPPPPVPPAAPVEPPPPVPPAAPVEPPLDPPPRYRSWMVDGKRVTRDCALCRLDSCNEPCFLPGKPLPWQTPTIPETAPDHGTFELVINGSDAPSDSRVLSAENEYQEQAADLAAFDAHRSMGGSRKGRGGGKRVG